jgi:hypothetical protein
VAARRVREGRVAATIDLNHICTNKKIGRRVTATLDMNHTNKSQRRFGFICAFLKRRFVGDIRDLLLSVANIAPN